MTPIEFPSAQSARLHELIQGPYRQVVREFTSESEYFELRQLMLLYVWAVAIATTIFSEAGHLTEEEAEAHVTMEADFCSGHLLPDLQKDYPDDLEADELIEAEDFLAAYQSALLFLAYRVEEDSDAEDVVTEYFEGSHDLGQYNDPDKIDESQFAEAIFAMFVALGDEAIQAAHRSKGLN